MRRNRYCRVWLLGLWSRHTRPPRRRMRPEEPLARQSADYKAMTLAYERARDAGSAAAARATALAAQLKAAQAALESEQSKVRNIEAALTESIASDEAARSGEELRRVSGAAPRGTSHAARFARGARRGPRCGAPLARRARRAARRAAKGTRQSRGGAGVAREARRTARVELHAEHARAVALAADMKAESERTEAELNCAFACRDADIDRIRLSALRTRRPTIVHQQGTRESGARARSA